MIKFILILFVIGIPAITFGQSPLTLGVKGGINFSAFHLSLNSGEIAANSTTRTSFSAGVFADLKLGSFSLRPELNLTGKGGNINNASFSDETLNVMHGIGKFNLLYLQLPVNFLYHLPLPLGNIYFGTGPYIAKGLTGKAQFIDNQGQSFSQDLQFGSNGDFKSFDYGADIVAGIKFKNGLLLNLNYDFGLLNVARRAGDGRLNTRTLGIGLGYAF